MKNTQLAQNISSNAGRAATEAIYGDSGAELAHLLFVARDIAEILKVYHISMMSPTSMDRLDVPTASRYAGMLCRTSQRIAELIERDE